MELGHARNYYSCDNSVINKHKISWLGLWEVQNTYVIVIAQNNNEFY